MDGRRDPARAILAYEKRGFSLVVAALDHELNRAARHTKQALLIHILSSSIWEVKHLDTRHSTCPCIYEYLYRRRIE